MRGKKRASRVVSEEIVKAINTNNVTSGTPCFVHSTHQLPNTNACRGAKILYFQYLPVAHVKWEYIIFSLSGFKSTNILNINSLAVMASLWGPAIPHKIQKKYNTALGRVPLFEAKILFR